MGTDRKGTLVILACHGVFDPATDRIYAEHPEDRPVYEAQLACAFQHLADQASASPFLVISGGPTKAERRCSESRSYLEQAKAMGMAVPAEVGLEEFALTSVENVLFSLYVYHMAKGVWPEVVEAISWDFKRERFEQTLAAIGRWQRLKQQWPPLRFFPVGDLLGAAKTHVLKQEKAYTDALAEGIDAYYAMPETRAVLERRDVHQSRGLARTAYAKYPLPF